MNTRPKTQVIRSLEGKPEYVLLPYSVYEALRPQIEEKLAPGGQARPAEGDFIPFRVENYVDNPVALARIQARVTQEELARRLRVTQAYVSKIERQAKVTPKVLAKVTGALETHAPKDRQSGRSTK